MPRDRQLLKAFGNIDGIYLAPSQKKSPDANARFSYRSDDDMQTMGRVFFGHGRMPGGLPLGFVTGRMLSEADEETLREWALVIVSHAGHVTAEEIQAISRYLSQGGAVVVSGEDCLKSDEYGRRHDTGLKVLRHL